MRSAKTVLSLVAATLAIGLMSVPSVAQDAPAGGEAPKPAAPIQPQGETPSRPQVKWTNIKVTVVGQDGKPVAGAVVASIIKLEDGKPGVPRGNAPTTADDGTLSTRMVQGRKGPLVAYSADGKQAGWTQVSAEGDDLELKLVVGPVGTIKGSMKLPEGKGTITAGSVSVQVPIEGSPRPVNIITISASSSFEFAAPAGELGILANPGTPTGMPNGMWQYDFIPASKRVNVKAGEELDAGELEIGLSGAAKLLGKEFPEWKVTESRNAPAGNQIKDYRGKWVMIEFWGFW